jgi:hypothetical protein
MENDETGERLYAEFYKCVRERGAAEGKISNQSQSMLRAEYVELWALADAIHDRCDQIRVKIREHEKATKRAPGI